ncbi:MAG: nicotinate-nucleotide diphosphorylase (carboxylating) [Flavobacteriaceae bacterium]|nr:nicotinate-nucleotide diphosphorylase (carboxylating) [Flavobacteriaceae bacterium]
MIEQDKFYETFKFEIDLFIKKSLEEDIGNGDYTTKSCLQSPEKRKMILKVNQPCILAGVELAKKIFSFYDSDIKIDINLTDGSSARIGEIGFIVSGKASSLLILERLVLNCMQRMSGIASLTNFLNKKICHTKCKILDTRKTTPGFRYPEKWAVLIGGGYNHRMGLFDTIIIKDNHIDFCGSITEALSRTKDYIKKNNLSIPVIVEVRNEQEIRQAMKFSWIDRILLDNMTKNQIIKSLKLIDRKYKTEASGNITLNNLVEIAETGVDYMSLGAITHSAKNIDLSLKAI